jgi:hypothetical protein
VRVFERAWNLAKDSVTGVINDNALSHGLYGQLGRTQMRVVTGLFDTRDQADAALDALEDAGIPSGDITLIAPGGGESEVSGAA